MIFKLKTVLLLSAATLTFPDTEAQSSPWFRRVPTAESGLTDSVNVHFVSIADINNDRYPDIIVVYTRPGNNIYTERKPIKLYLNTQAPGNNPKKRRFIDVTSESLVNIVPPDSGNNANCFTLADFNNDGKIDLVTGNYYHRIESYPNPSDRAQVYLGDGTGNFRWKENNGLSALGLINVRALTALDYDRDGNLDLFIPTWFRDYTQNIWDHARLLKGKGDGTFTDVTTASGINGYLEPMYGSAATDFDNDCNPDIFTAPYCRTGGKLFHNEGNGRFTDIARSKGYDLQRIGDRQNACTFSVIPEDVNNDGLMDIFLAVVHGGNQTGQFRSTVAINEGPDKGYSFRIDETLLPVRPPASSHRGDYDAIFLDMDNDGRKDIIMVQSTYMPSTDRTYFWHQQSDGSFKDATQALGMLVPQLKNSLGIEVFDFDLDGDDDFVVLGTAGTYFDLWENVVGQNNNWLSVEPVAHTYAGINKSGIGARVYVYYEDKMQMRELMAGRGMHTGQQPFILNFGLGNVTQVDSIVIRWPDKNCSRSVIYRPEVNKPATGNSFPVAVEESALTEQTLKIFPNPCTRYLVLQRPGLLGQVSSVQLTDVLGNTLPSTWHYSDNDKIVCDLGELPPGHYFLHLKDIMGKHSALSVQKK
jgi:hypothetical protein